MLPIIRVSGNSVAAMISASYGDRIHVEFSGLRFRFSTLEREFGLANYGAALRAWPSASLEAGGAARAGKARAKAAVDTAAAAAARARITGGNSIAVPTAHNIERHVTVVAGTSKEVGVVDVGALRSLVGFVAFLKLALKAVSYTHLTLPTKEVSCRSRWSPYH